MPWLEKSIRFFATNEIALGLVGITGLISFVLSIVVSFRTASISKILKYNNLADTFNKERKALWRTAIGHRDSIIIDETKSAVTCNNILIFVTKCHSKYKPLMSWKVRFAAYRLKGMLKKQTDKVKYNTVVNNLAELIAWLEIEEEKKNG